MTTAIHQMQQREERIVVSELEKGITIRRATNKDEKILNITGCYITTVMQHVKDFILRVHYTVTASEGMYQLNCFTSIPIWRDNDKYARYEKLIKEAKR